MALINCPECGKEGISEHATSCPNCGFPIAAHFKAIEEEKIRKEKEEKRREQQEKNRKLIEEREAKRREQEQERERIRMEKEEEKRKKNLIEGEMKPLIGSLECVYDWTDLSNLAFVIINNIRESISVGFDIKYVSSENVSNCIETVNSGILEYPYVIPAIKLNYDNGQNKKCDIQNSSGKVFKKYWDYNHFGAWCTPIVSIYTKDETQINEIIRTIDNKYKDAIQVLVSNIFDESEKYAISLSISKKTEVVKYTCLDETTQFSAKIEFEAVIFPFYVDINRNQIKQKMLANFRKVQLAQMCAVYLAEKNKFEGEITLYERLFADVSGLKSFFGPAKTEAYDNLKNMLKMGQQYTPELIEASFPCLSIVYHNLPNDIMVKKPKAQLEAEINKIFTLYTSIRDSICNELGIPANIDVANSSCATHTTAMRSNAGLKYILNELGKVPTKKIAEIISEYTEMLEEEIEEELARREAAREREELEGDGGGDIIKGMLGAYVGYKAGKMQREKNSKQHLRGSSGCQRNHSDFCNGCRHYDLCADRTFF